MTTSLMGTVSLGYDKQENNELPQESMRFVEGALLLTNIPTGFETEVFEEPTSIILECTCKKDINEDSIMDSVDTGLEQENTLIIECPKPEFKLHLCKENYLQEFKSKTEKQLARYNLNVYSKEEINEKIKNIINNSSNYISKKEVESMIGNLDFVDSTVKAHIDYIIPNDLFKL